MRVLTRQQQQLAVNSSLQWTQPWCSSCLARTHICRKANQRRVWVGVWICIAGTKSKHMLNHMKETNGGYDYSIPQVIYIANQKESIQEGMIVSWLKSWFWNYKFFLPFLYFVGMRPWGRSHDSLGCSRFKKTISLFLDCFHNRYNLLPKHTQVAFSSSFWYDLNEYDIYNLWSISDMI